MKPRTESICEKSIEEEDKMPIKDDEESPMIGDSNLFRMIERNLWRELWRNSRSMTQPPEAIHVNPSLGYLTSQTFL
jgi:hypothetical protein